VRLRHRPAAVDGTEGRADGRAVHRLAGREHAREVYRAERAVGGERADAHGAYEARGVVDAPAQRENDEDAAGAALPRPFPIGGRVPDEGGHVEQEIVRRRAAAAAAAPPALGCG
jgi:hypothetical protein